MLCFFRFLFFFFFFFICIGMSAIVHIQLWAASIDGPRPSWQPAIISTLSSTIVDFLFGYKIVVVVVKNNSQRMRK